MNHQLGTLCLTWYQVEWQSLNLGSCWDCGYYAYGGGLGKPLINPQAPLSYLGVMRDLGGSWQRVMCKGSNTRYRARGLGLRLQDHKALPLGIEV